jgi:WhiB family redox-sensing transcriptional regulator
MTTIHDTRYDDLNDQTELDRCFDAIVEPVAVRAPAPRCADGHGTLTHLFFSDHPIDTARAKAICGKCLLAEDCLQGALDREEPWGVWGGQLIENGRVVVNKRPRGRPPKHARPELVVDEVPIPPHLIAESHVA